MKPRTTIWEKGERSRRNLGIKCDTESCSYVGNQHSSLTSGSSGDLVKLQVDHYREAHTCSSSSSQQDVVDLST